MTDSPAHGGRNAPTGFWVSRPAETPVDLSLIIPTRNEAGNISMLLSQLTVALRGIAFEVIFVDDSDDDTPETVRRLAQHHTFRIGLIARPPERRANGLGGAVVEGFRAAQAPWMGVMDADLQHPPAVVRRLWEAAQSGTADLVLGTRLKGEGDTHGLSLRRTLVSRLLALTTRLTFPMRLWRVSDPLTGLFMLRNGAVDLDLLQPDGFKILLEILVRAPLLRLAEVPFRFDYRHAGQSKAGFFELYRLVRHYVRLRLSADLYLIRFLLVGLLGLVVNSALLYGMSGLLGLHYLWGAVIATQGSALWNFVLTERWVFDDRRQRGTRFYRFNGFMVMNNIMLAARLPVIWLLVRDGGLHYLWANLLTLVVLTAVRFGIADQILWQRLRNQPLNRTRRPFNLQPFTYTLHSLLTVRSEAALPALAPYLAESTTETADLIIRVTDDFRRVPEPGVWHFNDGLGRHGFCLDMRPGHCAELAVSPFLARSPHALYEQAVLPLARWLLAQRECALVQATAVVHHGRAILLTGPDPAATHNLAYHLVRHNSDFCWLGGAPVILDRAGRVYPCGALVPIVGPADRLRRKEHRRARLNAARLRFHARWRDRQRLPITSLDALWQRLAPPPAAPIAQLLPGVAQPLPAQTAQVVVLLPPEAAPQRPTAETVQAALLPPPPDTRGRAAQLLAIALWRRQGVAWSAVERETLAQALAGVAAHAVPLPADGRSLQIPLLTPRPEAPLPGDFTSSS